MSMQAAKKHLEQRQLPAATRALAGEDFVNRALAAAAARVTLEAHTAFASGPELSGGEDVEPVDVK